MYIKCNSCNKNLTKDEIALCKKLLGKNTKVFYCIECLADYLDVSVEDLEEKIEQFKEEGCTLFG